jgi:hypothetical protein
LDFAKKKSSLETKNKGVAEADKTPEDVQKWNVLQMEWKKLRTEGLKEQKIIQRLKKDLR